MRGQSIVVVALAALLLMLFVGLAIDGGSMYNQRRKAQNAADAAAMAGTRQMLTLYEAMIQAHPTDVDGTAAEETSVLSAITQTAAFNGVAINAGLTNLQMYFVNDSKQVVTVDTGNGCGGANPCQVGKNGSIPWTRGVKGIVVTARTQTPTYFMALAGYSQASAQAPATAYMGVAQDTNPDIGLLPIGFFTDTVSLNNLQIGRTYTIISGSTRQGSGNWGYADFNGSGNPATVVDAWIACGFNPAVTTFAQWRQWCTNGDAQNESRAIGPAQYWQGTGEPLAGPYTSTRLQWPPDPNGWWIAGSSGTTNSTCQYFEDISGRILNHDYLIPVFDRTNGQGGNNTKFHLVGLAWFTITSVDINCHPRQGEEQHWAIEGVFKAQYSPGSNGHHGDVRHTSNPVVFLEP